MSLLIGTFTIGFILSLLALGIRLREEDRYAAREGSRGC